MKKRKMNLKVLICQVLIIISFQLSGQVSICGEYQSYHPIDKQLLTFKDSLKGIGIDTILIYRHWKYTNGFNGYGKVVWVEKGKKNHCKLIFENGSSNNEVKVLEMQTMKNDSLINFFFKNRLDLISENPTNSIISISHDSTHFVEISYNNESYCYLIEGVIVFSNPEHLRSKWVHLLADEKVSTIVFYPEERNEELIEDKQEKERKRRGRRKRKN